MGIHKRIKHFVEYAVYICSYLHLPYSRTITEKGKKGKLRNFLLSSQALKQLRICYKQLSKGGIRFLIFEGPDTTKITGLSEEELTILNKQWTSGQLLNHDEYLKRAYQDNKRCYDFAKTRFKGTKLIYNGVYIQSADYSGEFYNVEDGVRKTFYQPDQYRSCIHIFGSCIARGFGVSDEFTISSYVQESVNKDYPDTFKVLNYGTGGKAGYEGIINDLKYIQNVNLKENDIVILMTSYTFASELYKKLLRNDYYECSMLFHAPHSFGWWFLNSTVHLNAIGNQVVSDYIYEVLKTMLPSLSTSYNDRDIAMTRKIGDSYYATNHDLKSYLKYIKRYKVKGKGNIGCIVMNCNPFTYGHKYLIKTALTAVDHLYVFVVEENKSFFTFEDRFQMVKEGTKELEHLTVLPSGQFMISSLTFPEYFEKEEKQDIKIDATNDLRIFGEKIAPLLRITTRFAGEEPIDIITRQYNEAMNTYLQSYGIQFVCIPRLKHNDFFISASIVRKKMKAGVIDEIKDLVPKTTLDMLAKYINLSE